MAESAARAAESARARWVAAWLRVEKQVGWEAVVGGGAEGAEDCGWMWW